MAFKLLNTCDYLLPYLHEGEIAQSPILMEGPVEGSNADK
jgi:hypothetical protein